MTAALLALAACSQVFKEPPGISYSESVRQLGIFPVYPPREDLQVGDIYGMEDDRKAERSKIRSVFLDSVDLTDEIRKYLNRRYTFGTTNASAPSHTIGDTTGQLINQSDAAATGVLFDTSAPRNLPITGFPSIEVDSGLSLSLVGASGGAGFGFGSSQTLKMALSFGLVTSYSVPIPVALEKLDQYCASRRYTAARQSCWNEEITDYLNQKYQLGYGTPKSIKKAQVLMVSKVYLARSISYTFNDQTLAAAAASAANREENPQATAPTVDGTLLTSAMSASNAPALVTALAAFQRALNESIKPDPNKDGVSISVSGYTRNSVTFEQIFQRPVVIGFEGAYFDAFPDDN